MIGWNKRGKWVMKAFIMFVAVYIVIGLYVLFRLLKTKLMWE